MAIAMVNEIFTPRVERMPDVRWLVGVRNDPDANDEFVAKCDTLDEAVELADSLRKRYFVYIDSQEIK